MNHIQKLTQQVAGHKATTEVARDGMAELRRYLTSPKFYTDTTVQVSDVLNRLAEIENAIRDEEARIP